jgi:ABC-2 type transport system permease protein
VVSALFAPVWLLAVLLVGPLLAVLSVNFCLMVSSRVNDPRVAEQLSTVVVLPLLVLFFGQIAGIVLVNRQMMLLLSLGLAALDVILLLLDARLFQRESILVHWR